jgi:DNA-binding response OmpR family regulator
VSAPTTRVLLVAQEPDLTLTLRDVLALERIDVRDVPDVATALNILSNTHYDAVIVNGSLHGTRERTLVKALLHVARAPPVIVLSDVPAAMAVGLEGATVLVKPASASDLLDAIRAAIPG